MTGFLSGADVWTVAGIISDPRLESHVALLDDFRICWQLMASAKWNETVSTARELQDRFRAEGSIAWYRGHRQSSWKLKSTLHRHSEGYLAAKGPLARRHSDRLSPGRV